MHRHTQIQEIKQTASNFPYLLKQIPDCPEKIFYLGVLPQKSDICISIVGTRKATEQGKIFAQKLARELSELGIIIVSGLALGIDSSAHAGAIDAKGKTVAVLAGGLNKIYPSQNQNLSDSLLKLGGCLISQYPPTTPNYPNQFLERNRIISGLSLATIVIEAPLRSGSLATARDALDQGREVFVVPGPVNNPNYEGSHKLIRDGARLITSTKEIIEDLGLETLLIQSQTQNKDLDFLTVKFSITDQNQIIILKSILNSSNPAPIDKIIKQTKLDPQIANQSIAYLIIAGIINEVEAGYVIT